MLDLGIFHQALYIARVVYTALFEAAGLALGEQAVLTVNTNAARSDAPGNPHGRRTLVGL